MTTANTHNKLKKKLANSYFLTTQTSPKRKQPDFSQMYVKSISRQSQVSNKQVIEIVPRMSSKYGLFLLVVLLRVTKVSKELRINLHCETTTKPHTPFMERARWRRGFLIPFLWFLMLWLRAVWCFCLTILKNDYHNSPRFTTNRSRQLPPKQLGPYLYLYTWTKIYKGIDCWWRFWPDFIIIKSLLGLFMK